MARKSLLIRSDGLKTGPLIKWGRCFWRVCHSEGDRLSPGQALVRCSWLLLGRLASFSHNGFYGTV